MAKSPGTIYKRGNGVWHLQASTGRKVNGKWQRVTKTVHGSKRDAEKALRDLVASIESGIDAKGGKKTFEAFAMSWYDKKQGSLAERTRRDYLVRVKALCGVIGDMELEKINVAVVEETMRAIEGNLQARKGEKPSSSTMRGYFGTLSQILGSAEDNDLIRRNPCARMKKPKLQKGSRRSLTNAQYSRMLEAIEMGFERACIEYEEKEARLKACGHANKKRNEVRGVHDLAFLIAARIGHATGARPSEIFALQWEAVDFKRCAISIHQATRTSEGGLKETKSEAGVRSIDVDPSVIEMLSRWRKLQNQAANAVGLEMGKSSFVVCSDAFNQARQSAFNHWWRKWASDNGFEGWQFYELRHTQATLLLDNGLDIKNTQMRMGHSSAAVTLNNYAHGTAEGQRRAADIMCGIAANHP